VASVGLAPSRASVEATESLADTESEADESSSLESAVLVESNAVAESVPAAASTSELVLPFDEHATAAAHTAMLSAPASTPIRPVMNRHHATGEGAGSRPASGSASTG
jgi:hypothetical protein